MRKPGWSDIRYMISLSFERIPALGFPVRLNDLAGKVETGSQKMTKRKSQTCGQGKNTITSHSANLTMSKTYTKVKNSRSNTLIVLAGLAGTAVRRKFKKKRIKQTVGIGLPIMFH